MRRHAEIYDAYCALLAQPDPPDLPRRAFAYTLAGDATALRDELKVELERAYVRYRIQAAGRDESAVVRTWRWKPLRAVGRKRA